MIRVRESVSHRAAAMRCRRNPFLCILKSSAGHDRCSRRMETDRCIAPTSHGCSAGIGHCEAEQHNPFRRNAWSPRAASNLPIPNHQGTVVKRVVYT